MNAEDTTPEQDSLQGLPVKLEIFEGPLDLLLHLIRENKVEITDIPIASITEQYLQHLELMRTLSLDVAGEFLVVAATLLYIKSRMLLPVEEAEAEEEGEDPRQELVRQLEEYQKYKEAGLALGELEKSRRMVFGRESIGPEGPKRTDYPLEVSIFELLAALKKLLESVPEEERVEIIRDRLTVAEKISEILEFLKSAEREVPFEELFREGEGRGQLIVTFLALLELIRLRMLNARQAVPGGQIMVADIRPSREESADDGENGENGENGVR
jgi:segregation and condensation protein A